MLAINIESLLREYQSLFSIPKLSKKNKGAFGEYFVASLFSATLSMEVLKKNYHSPYGELDLILFSNKKLVFIEVKLDLCGREDPYLWPEKQRRRFMRSIYHYKKTRGDKGEWLAYFVVLKKKKVLIWQKPSF